MDILIKNMSSINNNNDDEGIWFIAKTYTDEYIIIEIQVEHSGNMFKRSLYFASGIIYQSLPRYEPYESIPKLIMINILSYQLFIWDEEKSKKHWNFTIKEKDTNEEKDFEDLINIHFIELLKYKNVDREFLKKEHPWILLFVDQNNEYFKSENTPEIYKKASYEILNLQRKSGFKDLYYEREKQYLDYISEIEKMKNEGIEEGIKKEIKEAIEEGKKEGKEEGI